MSVLDFAINMEIKGAEYYQDLAKKTDSVGLKSILKMLAEDEVMHQRVFEAMKKRSTVPSDTSKAVTQAEDLFKKVPKEDFINVNEQLELYNNALEMEKKSIEYYVKQKDLPENSEFVEVIDRIISEEKKHCVILENIANFIGKPESWVEDAEFGTREEY